MQAVASITSALSCVHIGAEAGCDVNDQKKVLLKEKRDCARFPLLMCGFVLVPRVELLSWREEQFGGKVSANLRFSLRMSESVAGNNFFIF